MNCSFSGSITTMAVATVRPQGLPMPPRSTIDTRISESPKVKLFGATKPVIMAYTAPASPARKLPSVKAVIFQRATSMPKAAQAVSSSRTASSARPIQERSRRRTSVNATAAMTSASST